MFELTNEQRKCFGLLPVEQSWTRLELKPSPYDRHTTLSYLDGTVLRKFIETGSNVYREYELEQPLSDDRQFLLPKTAKGKPVLRACIASDSNEPYWAQNNWKVNRDLRNPKFRSELEQVCRQFDLSPSQLIPEC